MDLLQAIILGVVQGLTEFLPVSSSGHLVLVPWLLNWPDPGLVFDAMVHWGTLIAVVAYFWSDLWSIAGAWLASLRERSLNPDPNRRLAWLIIVGTLPAVVAGVLLEDFFESLFARPNWAAAFLLITGMLLVVSENWHRLDDAENHAAANSATADQAGAGLLGLQAWSIPVAGALLIGVAQAMAIAPGISRSGATIAAGLVVGLSRREAARFSFLLATPVILGAGLVQLVDLMRSGTAAAQAPTLIAGFIVAAVSGYLAIRFLLDYLGRHTLYLFAGYCWSAGLIGLAVYWLR